jgi:hypothetical protein
MLDNKLYLDWKVSQDSAKPARRWPSYFFHHAPRPIDGPIRPTLETNLRVRSAEFYPDRRLSAKVDTVACSGTRAPR